MGRRGNCDVESMLSDGLGVDWGLKVEFLEGWGIGFPGRGARCYQI